MLSKDELVDLLLNDVDSFNKEVDGSPVDLSEVDFSGANIEGAVFDNVDFLVVGSVGELVKFGNDFVSV